MLSWLAGRRSPSGVHLLTDDPLAALSTPVDKQHSVYAVSRVNPMFRDEAWSGCARPLQEPTADWQQSAADGSTYWHEPPPDTSLPLDPTLDPVDTIPSTAVSSSSQPDQPDSLEPPAVPPLTEGGVLQYRAAPPPPHSDLAELHRGPRVHHGRSLDRRLHLHRGLEMHSGMEVHQRLAPERSSTLPRPVWPSSVGSPPVSESPRHLSVSSYMTAAADHPTWPTNRQLSPLRAEGRLTLERRATFPPARTGFTGRLPSIPDEDIEPPADGQPDSIVTETLLQMTTPRTTPAGSVRDSQTGSVQDSVREVDSGTGSSTERAESFRWEGAGGDPEEEMPPALPPLAPSPGGYSWDRALEPLLQVLRSGEESPAALRRSLPAPVEGGDRRDRGPALPLPWRVSEAGTGRVPGPPSRASSELSQLYAELAAPRPLGRPPSEGLYAWPVSPPVPVCAPVRSCSPPPAYLNQLLPSDASSAGGRLSGQSGVRRTLSDARSDGSQTGLLPSDSSEGGSERRVTFSADTVDNEPGPARPRARRYPERGPGYGTIRGTARTRGRGFFAANVLSRLTGGGHKTAQKKTLGLPSLTLEVGREAALRREAARRWRSRHLCSAVTVVLVLVLLVTAGALIAWLWTTERRLFRV